MWMEKLRHGVLQVATDRGARYVEAGPLQRLRLLWMFRNFNVLPEEVLNGQERHLVTALCENGHPVPQEKRESASAYVIGTIERSQPFLPPKKASNGVGAVARHSA